MTDVGNPLTAMDGFFTNDDPDEMILRRPTSEDLGRRFEYGEGPVPISSALGIAEISIPVPYWQSRWKQHEEILLSHEGGVHFQISRDPPIYDLPKLAYCCLGMFCWRSTYTSENTDSLLQLMLVNFFGDCEDDALEIAKVVRSVLKLPAEHKVLKESPCMAWLKGPLLMYI